MKEKLSPENIIAATVAGLRHSKIDAYEIARTIVRDLGYFGYYIQRTEEAKQGQ
jgi:hypothetical protein